MCSSLATTGEPPVSAMPSRTPIQSYVSSSRMPSASEWGSSSHGHMHSDHLTPTLCTPPVAIARRHARSRGAQPAACTACSIGWTPADFSDDPMQAANAPPPTCTKTRSARWSMTSVISHPMVRPPSRHHAFSVPCTPNGTDPAATASRNRNTHGSPAGSESRRGHTVTVAPSVKSVSSTVADADGGTKTSIGHSTARAIVEAAIAALPHDAMARRGRDVGDHRETPASSDISNCTISVKRCRALCEPATLFVSSFTQTPPVTVNPR